MFYDLILYGPQACNYIKKRLQHRCFSVKFAKFLRIPFFTEHLWWLLLDESKRKLARGVYRTLQNIYNGTFAEAVNYFRKKTPS